LLEPQILLRKGLVLKKVQGLGGKEVEGRTDHCIVVKVGLPPKIYYRIFTHDHHEFNIYSTGIGLSK